MEARRDYCSAMVKDVSLSIDERQRYAQEAMYLGNYIIRLLALALPAKNAA